MGRSFWLPFSPRRATPWCSAASREPPVSPGSSQCSEKAIIIFADFSLAHCGFYVIESNSQIIKNVYYANKKKLILSIDVVNAIYMFVLLKKNNTKKQPVFAIDTRYR